MENPSSLVLKDVGGAKISSWVFLKAVSSVGSVIIGWNEDVFLCLSSSVGSFSISVVLEDVRSFICFLVTSAYRSSDDHVKVGFWRELRDIRVAYPGPWVLCGDFNVVRFQHERLGAQGSKKDSELFNDLIRDLDLIDLSLHGRAFMWSNKRDVPSFARLDRFFVSLEWVSHYPLFEKSAQTTLISGHSALVLDSRLSFIKKKIFRFEKMWLEHPSFDDLVKQLWGEALKVEDLAVSFAGKLRFLKRKLKGWESLVFGSIKKQKANLLEAIKVLESKQEIGSLSDKEKLALTDAKYEFLLILSKEEAIWKQRSREK